MPSVSESPERTVACDTEYGWARCPDCGRTLFWIEALVGSLVIKCQGCKLVVRFVVGVVVEG